MIANRKITLNLLPGITSSTVYFKLAEGTGENNNKCRR